MRQGVTFFAQINLTYLVLCCVLCCIDGLGSIWRVGGQFSGFSRGWYVWD